MQPINAHTLEQLGTVAAAFGSLEIASRQAAAALIALAPHLRRVCRAAFPGRYKYRARYLRRGRARRGA